MTMTMLNCLLSICSFMPGLPISSSVVFVHGHLLTVVCTAALVDVCLLPMDEGSCSRYTLRWYFDSKVQGCKPFIYSGCEGNDNRFLHQEECEETCLAEDRGTNTHKSLFKSLFCNGRELTDYLLCRSSSLKDGAMIVVNFFCSSATGMLAF